MRQDADHRRDGVTDDRHVVEAQLVEDEQHVIGVPLQRGVADRVVRRRVRVGRSREVEQDDAVVRLEGRRDVAPHRLAATEPVHEQQAGPSGRPVTTTLSASAIFTPRIVGQPRDMASTHTVIARMSATSWSSASWTP